ncbi:MAG: alpha/beta hydrolase [Ferruginibacter sp.]
MQHIYIISGLGADRRMFQNLDLSGMEVTYIDWIRPLKNETIEDYAKRLSQKIVTEKPIIIGLSFGGMMAIEISKIMEIEKIILISSAKTKKEIPFYYKMVGKIGFHKITPASFLKKTTLFSNWYFSVKNNKDKKILVEIIKDADPVFLTWAVDKILKWKNIIIPLNLRHIHGTADRALPIQFIRPDVKVPGAGHLMVLDRPEIITDFIKKEISFTQQ